MTEWKRPPRHVFIHGSLEKNPPPVDYRPRLLNLLKHLQVAVSCLESLPIEGKGSLFCDELNTATWDAWRRLIGSLHFAYEALKSDFGYEPGAICDHPVISRPANQAINWLGVEVPRLSDWMLKEEVDKAQKIPALPADYCEVIKKSEEAVRNEIQTITTNFKETNQAGEQTKLSPPERVGSEPPEPPEPPASNSLAGLALTRPDFPSQWAKIFGISRSTLMRRFKDGKIRFNKLSSKSYQIVIDDLPAQFQDKFRNPKK